MSKFFFLLKFVTFHVTRWSRLVHTKRRMNPECNGGPQYLLSSRVAPSFPTWYPRRSKKQRGHLDSW